MKRVLYQDRLKVKSYKKQAYKNVKDKENLEIFEQFLKEYSNENNLSDLRIGKYYYVLANLLPHYKGKLEDPKLDDFHHIIKVIKESNVADSSKADRVIMFKTFYKWFKDKNRKTLTESQEDALYWLLDKGKYGYTFKINKQNNKEKRLISEEECLRLIDISYSVRDKAILSILWELGIRVGELLSLRIKDVKPYENGYMIDIKFSKTEPRNLPFINGSPYLQTYLEQHPLKKDPESYLWVSDKKRDKTNPYPPLSYDALMRQIKRMGIKAKLDFSIHPHQFRHTCATRKASLGWNEAKMNTWFGWSMNTRMAGVYIHKSGIDMKRLAEETLGIKSKPKTKDETLKPVNCNGCNTLNEPTNKFCKECHKQLSTNQTVPGLNTEELLHGYQLMIKEMAGLKDEISRLKQK